MRKDENDGRPVFGETEYTHGGAFGCVDVPKTCASSTCGGVYKYTDCKVEIDGKWVSGHCWYCPRCRGIWFQDEYTRDKYNGKIRIVKKEGGVNHG